VRRPLLLAGLFAGLTLASLALGQTASGPRHVAVLIDSKAGDANVVVGLSERLAAAGLTVGRDVNVQVSSNEQDLARIPAMARAAVAAKPAVIYTTHELWVDALKDATTTIPIVFAFVTEPVSHGFVQSFARSGTNMVGVADRNREVMAKRVEILRAAFPRARRLMVLGAYTHLTKDDLHAIEDAASRLKFTLIRADISSVPLAAALAAADTQKPDAVLPFGTLDVRPGERGSTTLIDYVNRRKIPAIYSNGQITETGGLMSLQEDASEQIRRSADMVVKILGGARPSEMAIDQADKFELVINMSVAKKSGFAIPQAVLLRADRVIE
jgi:putative ABC transport system substrate-binding protein